MKFKFHYSIILCIVILSCSGSQKENNKHLGELPEIAADYEKQLILIENEIKESNDLEESFKLKKEYKDIMTKAKNDVINALNNLNSPEIPFNNLDENPFQVLEIKLNNANMRGLVIKGKVKIEKDLRNKNGEYEKSFFSYVKAVDDKGNILGKPAVMSSDMSNRGPFTIGTEVHIFGRIGPLSSFKTLDKIVFINKDEYQQKK